MFIRTVFCFTATALLIYYVYPETTIPANTHIDRLVVYKEKQKMIAYTGERAVRTYTVALGRQPVGKKRFEGDMKTPEGVYTINDRNPNSSYHKNLGVSYPNEADVYFASERSQSAGGLIKIHGLRNGSGRLGKFHRWHDWTHGCIAVTNAEIDELYEAVAVGATIEIKP